jgi:hypothetical protein
MRCSSTVQVYTRIGFRLVPRLLHLGADDARRRKSMPATLMLYGSTEAEFYKVDIEPCEGGKVSVSVAALRRADDGKVRSSLIEEATVRTQDEALRFISRTVDAPLSTVTAAMAKAATPATNSMSRE